jgi:hypothetical protein
MMGQGAGLQGNVDAGFAARVRGSSGPVHPYPCLASIHRRCTEATLVSKRRTTRAKSVFTAVGFAVALLAATLAAPMGAAAAYPEVSTDCPAGNLDYGIDHWNKIYPGIAQPDRGVTLCQGMGGALANEVYAYLQIVRPAAGGRLRVVSQRACDATLSCSDEESWEHQFVKHTAEDWFMNFDDFVPPLLDVDSTNLFSTTNAGFFVDTDNSHPTSALSLPEVKIEYPGSAVSTSGWAFGNHLDPAWGATKEGIGMTNPQDLQQPQWFAAFPAPTEYTFDDILSHLERPEYLTDGLFGFDMAQTSADEYARRTVVGTKMYLAAPDVYGAEAVILTTTHHYSLEELGAFFVDMGVYGPEYEHDARLQLDGGNSTSMFNKLGGVYSIQSSYPTGARKVPEVLAVYEAPEE